MDFKGKKILVTGATGGIGGDIVRKFLSLNATVLGTGTNLEKLNSLKEKNPKLITEQFDISQHDQIDEFIDLYIQIKKAYIRYKILKHNILKQAEKEGPGVYESSSESGNIHVQEFKSQFRSVLTKEFSKLDIVFFKISFCGSC